MEQLGENLFYTLPWIALLEDQSVLELLACLLAFVAHLLTHFVCGFPLGGEEEKNLKKNPKVPVTDCFFYLFLNQILNKISLFESFYCQVQEASRKVKM